MSDDQPQQPQQQRRPPPTDAGILYFSRIPKDMRPNEIREFFTRFGPIFRQKFVVAATNTKRAQALRKKIGKNKALQFKEGWLEFTNFKDAKDAADQMNSEMVDVKRTRRASGDMWHIRCLPRGYRWEDLVTEMEGEKRVRRMKLQQELQREREINEAYRQLAMKELARRQGIVMVTNNNEDGAGENNNSNNNSSDKKKSSSSSSVVVSKNNADGSHVERDENILSVSDFVKEANSIPQQLMKFRRQRQQAAKKAFKEEQKQKKEAAQNGDDASSKNTNNKDTRGKGAVALKKKNTFVASAQNRIAKVYTSDGYRDLYSSS